MTPSAIRLTVEKITPAVAEKMLATSKGNRKIRSTWVNTLTGDMAAGRWRLTGDPIRENGDGSLIDGHHRLHAVVASGVPIITAVARGVSDTAHPVIDVGKPRSMADEFKFRGEVNVNVLAATCSMVWRYDNDKMHQPDVPSRQELMDLLGQFPEIRDSVAIPVGQVRIPHTPLATCHFLAARDVDQEEANGWIARLKNDVGFEEGDPVLALRRYAENVSGARTLRPNQIEWLALSIKSFNHWLAGDSIRSLRWRRGGTKREQFPKLKNPYEQVAS